MVESSPRRRQIGDLLARSLLAGCSHVHRTRRPYRGTDRGGRYARHALCVCGYVSALRWPRYERGSLDVSACPRIGRQPRAGGSFDRRTGNLWIGDAGQNRWEEIDFLPRSRLGQLVNYGWDVFEGRHRYEDKAPTGPGTLLGPAFEYPHSQGCTVIGGFVYRGSQVPAARGRYFFGDYCSGRIWSFLENASTARDIRRHSFTVPQLTSFGENARGELFLASGDGTIYRLGQD